MHWAGQGPKWDRSELLCVADAVPWIRSCLCLFSLVWREDYCDDLAVRLRGYVQRET